MPMHRPWLVLLLLLPALLAKGQGKHRRLSKGAKASGRSGRTSLGSWTVSAEPMHKTVCDGRTCRPGEGNLKGYQHWSQPYEPVDPKGATRRAECVKPWAHGHACPRVPLY